MKPLLIESTSDTPKVVLDADSGTFEISKRCFPEDALRFFAPIHEWLNNYSLQPNTHTHFHIRLEYYNTASSKQLYKLLALLKDISEKNEVIVYWHYHSTDTDMQASGERYSKLLDFELRFIED